MKQTCKKHIAIVLLVPILFLALPKAYIHSLLGHKHLGHHSTQLLLSENNETIDCPFDKYDHEAPYLNLSFSPILKKIEVFNLLVLHNNLIVVFKHHFNCQLLRGPPIAKLCI